MSEESIGPEEVARIRAALETDQVVAKEQLLRLEQALEEASVLAGERPGMIPHATAQDLRAVLQAALTDIDKAIADMGVK